MKKNQNIKKEGSFLIGGALGHVAQNGAYLAATRTKKGAKATGDFMLDRLSEGYHGRGVKDRLAEKITKVNAKYDPTQIFKSKTKHLRDSVKAGRRYSGGLKGAGYNIMPEAEHAAHLGRGIGVELKKSDIDLDNMSPAEMKSLVSTLRGEKDDLGILPYKARVMIAGQKGITANMDEYKKSNTGRIMNNLADAIERKKGISEVGKESLKSREKNQMRGYNIGHGALVAAEPAMAAINGVKRILSKDIKAKPGDGKVVGGAKDMIGGTIDYGKKKLVTDKSKAGMKAGKEGKDYKETLTTRAKRLFMSPAVEDMIEDSQRFGKAKSNSGK